MKDNRHHFVFARSDSVPAESLSGYSTCIPLPRSDTITFTYGVPAEAGMGAKHSPPSQPPTPL